jgi:hypothetical protein
MPVNTVSLRDRQGRIWPTKPTVSPSGVVSVLKNVAAPMNDEEDGIAGASGKQKKLTAACLNDAGDAMVTCDARGILTLFQLTKNRYVQLHNLGGVVTAMKFSSLRRGELTVATRDGTIYVFDTDAKRLLATLKNAHKQAVESISFHPRNAVMITASVDGINIWDLKKWTKLKTLGAGSGICTASFNAKGTSLLVAFKDDTVVSWSTGTYEVQGIYKLPSMDRPYSIQTLATSPDGRYLLAGGQSQDMYLWETASKQLISCIEVPKTVSYILNAVFLPDSKRAAILGDDGRMMFLQVAGMSGISAKIDMELGRKRSAIIGFAVDSACNYCSCTMSDGSIVLYDVTVAKKYNAKVRQAALRMGSTVEEVDRKLPMYDPNVSKAQRPEYDAPEPPSVVLVPKYPRPVFPPAPIASPDNPVPGVPTEEKTLATEVPAILKKPESGLGVQPAATIESRALARDEQSAIAIMSELPKEKKAPSSGLVNKVFGEKTKARPQGRARKRQTAARKQQPVRPIDQEKIEKRLSRGRLIALLRSYGTYPEKYRLLIWTFLLQLPRNEQAYGLLTKRGGHPNYTNLSESYPIRDQRLLRRLQKQLSAMAHWSPVFSNLSYLPALAFPFTKVFGADSLGSFETIVSFVLNWCDGWFETFPHPPIPVLAHVERLMAHHDQPLLDNLVARGIDARTYAWRIMRTLFTEVLSRDEWLQLMDHVLTHADEPCLLAIGVVAYLKQFRSAIIGAGSNEEIEAFLHRQNPISMEAFVKSIYHLRSKTPAELIPPRSEGSAANFPLMQGQYPIFDRYPQYVVNFQLQERQRIEEEERVIREKTASLQNLQTRAEDLARRERDWQIQQAEFLRLEKERVEKMAEDAEIRRKDQERLARQAEERRLQQVAFLQESAERALEYQKQALEIARTRGDLETKVATEEQEAALKSREKEEELLALEFQSLQQVHEMQYKRKVDDDLAKLKSEFDAEQTQAQLAHERAMRDMKLDDERRAALLKARTDELANRASELEVERVRRDLSAQQAKTTLEHEAKLAAAERDRILRSAKLDGALAADEEIEQKARRQRILFEEEDREQKMMAMELKRWREEQNTKRAALIEEEEQRLRREKEAREERLNQLESLQRKREFQESILKRKSGEGAEIAEEEKRLQTILSQIEEQRAADRKQELDLLFKEQELREKSEFNKVLQETDRTIVEEERVRFDRIRAHYRNVAATADEREILKHEERMKEVVAQRQQEIMEHAAATRAQARQEEIAKLKEEFGSDADRIIAMARLR